MALAEDKPLNFVQQTKLHSTDY